MQQYRYPGKLSEQHPVHTRISILERFNLLEEAVQSGGAEAFVTSVKTAAQDAQGNRVGPPGASGPTQTTETKFTDTAIQVANRQIAGSIEDAIAQIYLYAPSSINFADGLQYDNQELGILAATMFGAADAAATEGKEITAGGNVLNFLGGAGAAAVTEMGKRSGISQQLRLRAGVARNPRTEMLFRAPSLRQLSLTWKLMPTNAQESQTCFDMIQTMRQHAYPSVGDTGQKFALAFPNVFKIDFVTRGGGKAQMINFAKAYCTSVTTNYGSSGPAFFSGGKPVEIDLTMTFQETEIQTRESIRDGGF